jgi:hypothetical protein
MFHFRDKHDVKKYRWRFTGLALAAILVVSSIGGVLTDTVFAQTPTPVPPAAATGVTPTATSNPQVTCSIEKLGWILCPLIQTAGKVGDQAFEFLANNFLETEPQLVSSQSGTYTAWLLARNLANLMFIAAFLIVILSQVTGRGINNYGIKKLLPRLIIGAIAVNVSYYICQIMVDVSNILGYELENFLINIAKTVSTQAVFPPPTPGTINVNTSNGPLGTMATAILGIAAIVWFLLPVLFLGITVVVVACIVIIAILLMRKAIIVLLVVASPVAFVFYLLPNTERYFQKWLKMFWQLLMVFPVVGVLFGGGQLASAIILVSGSNTTVDSSNIYHDTSGKCIQLPKWNPTATPLPGAPTTSSAASVANCGPQSTPFLLGLVAAGVAVAPLFAVWAVLKGALSSAGAIGGKIAGTIQNAGSGATKKLQPFEKNQREAFGQYLQTKALNGDLGGKRLGYVAKGAAGFRENRNLSKKRREARLNAAKESYAAGDEKASRISGDTRQAQLEGQAAQAYEAEHFATQVATSSRQLGKGGQYSDKFQKQFDSQQTKAMIEAVKDAELHIDTNDLKQLGEDLKAAARGGDAVGQRALENTLIRNGGSEGIKILHSTIDELEASGANVSDLKTNIRSSHGNMKDMDQSLADWANNPTDKTSLKERFGNAGTWNSLTAAQFAGLKGHAQGEAAKHISERAMEDLLKTPQLKASIKSGAYGELEKRDARFAPPAAPTAPPPTPPTPPTNP